MAREPEKPVGPADLAVEPSRRACAGAAAAYLLRRVAARAGSYAPGIQERLFFDLQRDHHGRDLDRVEGWYERTARELHRLGYPLCMRRVAFRTPAIVRWVEGGGGFRGAILTTDAGALWPEGERGGPHAVALTVGPAERGKDRLLLVDPWPGRTEPGAPPPTLEAAHRLRKYGCLVVYWTGWA